MIEQSMDAVIRVQKLHAPRYFSGDGYGWSVCAECRQTWPCATATQIDVAFAIVRHANGNVKLGSVLWPFVCCHLHKLVECCDPNDCGPCCEDCPTCPTLARQRGQAT